MRSSRRVAAIALSAVAALIAAVPAHAATVHTDGDTVVFAAAPGEVNDVLAIPTLDGILVTDSGSAITTGAGCAPAPGGALCADTLTDGVLNGVVLRLGDGDDKGTFDDEAGTERWSALYGGGGDDRLAARSAHTTGAHLEGGDGSDVLHSSTNFTGRIVLLGGLGGDELSAVEILGGVLKGGAGADRISWTGAGGEDAQIDGDAGTDTIEMLLDFVPSALDGGSGTDTLTAARQDDGIVLDLAGCPECSFERVIGSSFSDVLLGDGMPNIIHGGDGDDVIDPRGEGDFVHGEAGMDTITTTDSSRDIVRCGDGLDVTFPDARDWLARDCRDAV
jgi:hypothetical protein